MTRTALVALGAALLVTVSAVGAAADTSAIVVPQEMAPLQIYEYATDYDSKGDKSCWVEHDIRYKNISGKKIEAVRFGLLELNSFHELIGGAYWQVLERSGADDKERAVVLNESPEAVFFQGSGTGLVWVDAVRYQDGSLWQVERGKILEELKKTRPEMTEQNLRLKQQILVP